MKALVLTIMLTALYLLCRTVCPKPQDSDVPSERDPDTDGVTGASRHVPALRSRPQPNAVIVAGNEHHTENVPTFAPDNRQTGAVIPSGELDEVFSMPPEPMAVDYPLERMEDEPEDAAAGEPDMEEEAEELLRSPGREAVFAGGFSYEEMTEAIDTAANPQAQPDEAAQAAGKVLYQPEKTDLFEQLISGEAGRETNIKAVIERHVQSILPEEPAENENDHNEDSDFNIADFLS
ncbi:MAG: hypothetical protein LBR08_10205 [Bacteroidales bacterium]|jgi:hypothetical protein|nr:hypothetical protein [Bacteroidales bacterium]